MRARHSIYNKKYAGHPGVKLDTQAENQEPEETYQVCSSNALKHICVLNWSLEEKKKHGNYNDVIMGAIAFQITSLTTVLSTVYLDTDKRKHQSSASLAFVWGIHRGPVNSPHKWSVTRKMFPFDDVIMYAQKRCNKRVTNCTHVFDKYRYNCSHCGIFYQ